MLMFIRSSNNLWHRSNFQGSSSNKWLDRNAEVLDSGTSLEHRKEFDATSQLQKSMSSVVFNTATFLFI